MNFDQRCPGFLKTPVKSKIFRSRFLGIGVSHEKIQQNPAIFFGEKCFFYESPAKVKISVKKAAVLGTVLELVASSTRPPYMTTPPPATFFGWAALKGLTRSRGWLSAPQMDKNFRSF
jgi:hypothetical protein